MQYFFSHNSAQQNKDLYKSLCKKLHPDAPTGNAEQFIEMKSQYDLYLKNSVYTGPINNTCATDVENDVKNDYKELEKLFMDAIKKNFKKENVTIIEKKVKNLIDKKDKNLVDLFDLAITIIKNKH